MKHFYNKNGTELNHGNCTERVAIVNRRMHIFSLVVLEGQTVQNAVALLGISTLTGYLDLNHYFRLYLHLKVASAIDEITFQERGPDTMSNIRQSFSDRYIPKSKDARTVEKFISGIRNDQLMMIEYRANFSRMFLHLLEAVAPRIKY